MREKRFWDDLGRMLAEIDYMMHKAVGKVRQKAGMYRYPHAHIKEKENEIIIEVELPGMRKEDIEINSDEYGVEIKAEKRAKIEKGSKDEYSKQKSYSRFYRRIALPAEADHNRLKAAYNEGILELGMLRKRLKARKSVEIE